MNTRLTMEPPRDCNKYPADNGTTSDIFSAFPPSVVVIEIPLNRWNVLQHGHWWIHQPLELIAAWSLGGDIDRWNKFHHGQVAARRRLGDNLRGMAMNTRLIMELKRCLHGLIF